MASFLAVLWSYLLATLLLNENYDFLSLYSSW
jgi:hypothetical protein